MGRARMVGMVDWVMVCDLQCDLILRLGIGPKRRTLLEGQNGLGKKSVLIC